MTPGERAKGNLGWRLFYVFGRGRCNDGLPDAWILFANYHLTFLSPRAYPADVIKSVLFGLSVLCTLYNARKSEHRENGSAFTLPRFSCTLHTQLDIGVQRRVKEDKVTATATAVVAHRGLAKSLALVSSNPRGCLEVPT
jgi:hypothetical protein